MVMHGNVSRTAWATYPSSLKPKITMSVQNEYSFWLGCRPGQQGPLHEVRAVSSVSRVSIVIASNSKTIQGVRGAPFVDTSTSKTQQEDTGLSHTGATNDSGPKWDRTALANIITRIVPCVLV